MKRVSNLAFNNEYPKLSGRSGLPRKNAIEIRRDKANPFDQNAVGIFFDDESFPVGWLFKKDSNRNPVLSKLDEVEKIDGHIEQAAPGEKVKFVVVFWL